jgi:hypothetical protein
LWHHETSDDSLLMLGLLISKQGDSSARFVQIRCGTVESSVNLRFVDGRGSGLHLNTLSEFACERD